MANSLFIGLSALTATQRGLDLVGQNIANASTPGYHRQILNLGTRVLGGEVGEGVDILGVTRVRSLVLENALTTSSVELGRLRSELDSLRQVETLVTPGEGTALNNLEQLFNQIEQLATRPEDQAQRLVVLNTANRVAESFNSLVGNLDQLSTGLHEQIRETVNQINLRAVRIAELNDKIRVNTASGRPVNELRDQRDQAITELADLVDVRVIEQSDGTANIIAGNVALVVGSLDSQFTAGLDAAGTSVVTTQGTPTPLTFQGGQLAGLLQVRNSDLVDYRARIETIVQGVFRRIDSVQATGLGTTGPLTSTLGTRSVGSTTTPLATAGTAFPVQAGSLFLTVTDLTTGQRSLSEIAIDPATQSLQDVAGLITTASAGQVQATVTTNNTLQLQSQPGFAFDFAGRLPSTPQNLALNGTTTPSVTGVYTGSANDNYSFQVVGSGTVGTTPNLTLEVRDSANNLLNAVNIGQGYTPGTRIPIGNGLSVQLSAGTTNNGSFSVPTVAEPDTSGLLATLGINTLFTGASASSLRVNQQIVNNPTLLAGSRSGEVGDSLNLQRLAALRDQPFLNGGTQTYRAAFSSLVSDVASRVEVLDQEQTAQNALNQQLFAEQQSVSGVDPNEEIVNMVQLQRSYQMAARYINVINTTLDELVNLVR